MKDSFNNIGNFDPSSASGMVQQGQPGFNTIWKVDPFDFEPRIGMAWDVRGNGTTVVRFGFGLIHETWNLETFEGQFGMQGDGSTAINAIPTGATISCGIPALVPSISCPTTGGGTDSLGFCHFCSRPALLGSLDHVRSCSHSGMRFRSSYGIPRCRCTVRRRPSQSEPAQRP